MSYHDYESMGYLNWRLKQPEIMEAWTGTSIVKWHGNIEGQLVNLLQDAEKGRNYTYADKLREFLKIWRANPITGSINRETLEILKAAADVLSVDQWDMSAYFRSLRDSLRVLIASEEQLPRGDFGNEPTAGGMGGGAGGPPMSPAFGPEDSGPGGPGGAGGGGAGGGGAGGPPPGGPEGAEGAPGAGMGAPGDLVPGESAEPVPGEGEAAGAEPGAPAPEEGTQDQVEPEEMPGGRLGLA